MNWPTHPDGTRMSIDEMPSEQRRKILEAARKHAVPSSNPEVAQMMDDAIDRIAKAPQKPRAE